MLHTVCNIRYLPALQKKHRLNQFCRQNSSFFGSQVPLSVETCCIFMKIKIKKKQNFQRLGNYNCEKSFLLLYSMEKSKLWNIDFTLTTWSDRLLCWIVTRFIQERQKQSYPIRLTPYKGQLSPKGSICKSVCPERFRTYRAFFADNWT